MVFRIVFLDNIFIIEILFFLNNVIIIKTRIKLNFPYAQVTLAGFGYYR